MWQDMFMSYLGTIFSLFVACVLIDSHVYRLSMFNRPVIIDYREKRYQEGRGRGTKGKVGSCGSNNRNCLSICFEDRLPRECCFTCQSRGWHILNSTFLFSCEPNHWRKASP